MTAFNTDYNNTELLDQELTIEELESVAGGGRERFEAWHRWLAENENDEPETLAEVELNAREFFLRNPLM